MTADNVSTPVQLLIKAKEILETSGWCQGTYARDREGTSTQPTLPAATCFCAVGAILRADGAFAQYDASIGAERAIDCLQWTVEQDIPGWNDANTRTKEQVLEAFDNAINSCK